MEMMEEKKCFVIAPIGEEKSEIRERSDQILRHIISPIATGFGYDIIRADKISEPGIITSQIIQHLIEDPLVIADLTGPNANVFYELAIRHLVKKPVIHLIRLGETIPFDVSSSRAIEFDHQNLDSVECCKNELKKQIESIETNSNQICTPISVAIDWLTLSRSDNPQMKMLADLHEEISGLKNGIFNMINQVVRQVIDTIPEERYPFLERQIRNKNFHGPILKFNNTFDAQKSVVPFLNELNELEIAIVSRGCNIIGKSQNSLTRDLYYFVGFDGRKKLFTVTKELADDGSMHSGWQEFLADIDEFVKIKKGKEKA